MNKFEVGMVVSPWTNSPNPFLSMTNLVVVSIAEDRKSMMAVDRHGDLTAANKYDIQNDVRFGEKVVVRLGHGEIYVYRADKAKEERIVITEWHDAKAKAKHERSVAAGNAASATRVLNNRFQKVAEAMLDVNKAFAVRKEIIALQGFDVSNMPFMFDHVISSHYDKKHKVIRVEVQVKQGFESDSCGNRDYIYIHENWDKAEINLAEAEAIVFGK